MDATAIDSNMDLPAEIKSLSSALGIGFNDETASSFLAEGSYSEKELSAVVAFLKRAKSISDSITVGTMLKLSRIPTASLKTFDNFNFSDFSAKDAEALKIQIPNQL